MKGVRPIALGFFGCIIGTIAAIAHAGPLDKPYLGFIVAACLVLAAGWAVAVFARSGADFSFAFWCFGLAEMYLLVWPGTNDRFDIPTSHWGGIWLVASLILFVTPTWLVMSKRLKERRRRQLARHEQIEKPTIDELLHDNWEPDSEPR